MVQYIQVLGSWNFHWSVGKQWPPTAQECQTINQPQEGQKCPSLPWMFSRKWLISPHDFPRNRGKIRQHLESGHEQPCDFIVVQNASQSLRIWENPQIYDWKVYLNRKTENTTASPIFLRTDGSVLGNAPLPTSMTELDNSWCNRYPNSDRCSLMQEPRDWSSLWSHGLLNLWSHGSWNSCWNNGSMAQALCKVTAPTTKFHATMFAFCCTCDAQQ